MIVFACTVVWTTFFSCFNSPRIRSYRNLGILAAFTVGIIAPGFVGIVSGVTSWLVFALIGGVAYYLWAFWCHVARGRSVGDRIPSPIVLAHGLVMWPVMLPEAIEYAGAEAGIFRPASGSRNEPSREQ
jgi:hypothetical protein